MANKTSSKPSTFRRTSANSTKKSTKSRVAKSENAVAENPLGGDEVAVDRRRSDRRDEEAGAAATTTTAGPQLERRKKVNRRRQIDPTTCERDYTEQEVEFMNALDDYKRKSGRMFPTCSEVLEVLRGLGYVKLSTSELGAMSIDSAWTSSAKPMPCAWGTDASVVNANDGAAAECESQVTF